MSWKTCDIHTRKKNSTVMQRKGYICVWKNLNIYQKCYLWLFIDETDDTGEKKTNTQGSYEDLCADCLGRSLYLIMAVKTYWKGSSYFCLLKVVLSCDQLLLGCMWHNFTGKEDFSYIFEISSFLYTCKLSANTNCDSNLKKNLRNFKN